MNNKAGIFLLLTLIFYGSTIAAQNLSKDIDSLVNELKTAGRNWNDFSVPLIKIGEPAVPALIKNAEDKNLPVWNRRISIITLNNIHSPKWKKPALRILFDEEEDPGIRNHATAGLTGFDLSSEKEKLWDLYQKTENQFYKSNLAGLLVNADTVYAYQAYHELYTTQDGHIQRNALLNLAKLKPGEAIYWYLNAIQNGSWMTANLASDSLISSNNFNARELINVYSQAENNEKIQWRIVYILGQRKEPDLLPFLLEALKNKSWLVHNEAAVAISRYESGLVLPMLQELKKDSLDFVRQNAKWLMSNIKLD
ncbi:HEAT repeat domain-containing protein [uncultured Draconibacterium sp.]|uniref:HEAT repeat domain-containing protein n=1 Tax=uncultured Draconibacterium sp. TaxID=1573823 RepID=UPI0025FBF384|nr:HEAT repeat domain-containing protein [uncultured Draconibacterium sp.]